MPKNLRNDVERQRNSINPEDTPPYIRVDAGKITQLLP
jgi:hypothetical protein